MEDGSHGPSSFAQNEPNSFNFRSIMGGLQSNLPNAEWIEMQLVDSNPPNPAYQWGDLVRPHFAFCSGQLRLARCFWSKTFDKSFAKFRLFELFHQVGKRRIRNSLNEC